MRDLYLSFDMRVSFCLPCLTVLYPLLTRLPNYYCPFSALTSFHFVSCMDELMT